MAAVGLTAAVHDQVRRDPDATALVWHDEEYSYGELWRLAQHQLERVSALALDTRQPLGLRVGKSPQDLAVVLGVLLSGHPFLLPALNQPEDVLRELFAQAGCAAEISADGTAPAHPVPAHRAPAHRAPAHRAWPQPPQGVTFMLTTSGSTGLPKIVPLTAVGIDRFIGWAAQRFAIGRGTRVLNYAPISFDLCLLDIWTTLAHGGAVVLVDPTDALHAGRLAALVRRWRVQVVQAVPMLFGLLTGSGEVFDSVEHAISTGDSMPPGGVAALSAAFPQARLYNLYGCTETNDSLLHEIDPARDDGTAVPLGTPLPGVEISVLDADGNEVRGAGSGELLLRSPFQSPGYLGAARGAGRFGPHPANPSGPQWYRSGDLVSRQADGNLVLLGRTDFRVKVRGVGVDLGEVENALLTHPEVREAVVLAVPNAIGGKRLRALAYRTPGSSLNTLGLRRHCAAVLPRGAMPEEVLIVDESFPRNANGKVDRTAVAREHPATTADPKEV
ncbi:AMP-binding protein [Saccharopolyspora sp. 5N708]|uniref:AMP-binding protein n=1 Tax=Saccharopolyspora sp. 5N708 TaxID=3457424 RepID=UPI003FCFE090